ncbi:MAG: hypothetical protein KDC92_13530 [Bacteroidetes bacterium]|nr:hypothetical protein [Bacteroidota bacterium]
MKKIFYIIGLIFIIQSCLVENKSVTKDEKEEVQSQKLETTKSVKDPNIKGRKELLSFEKKYESQWTDKPQNFPYSKGAIFKVFKLDCSGECFKSEFRKRKSDGVEISEKDFSKLVELLREPKSYDNSTAACYDPKFGLVVYDKENIPTEFLSICLDCNSFRTYPGQIEVNYENKILFGFSKEARNELRQLFFKWGIDYYGFSSFWDDEKEYKKYLEKK